MAFAQSAGAGAPRSSVDVRQHYDVDEIICLMSVSYSYLHTGTLYEFAIAQEAGKPRFSLVDLAAREQCAWSGATVGSVWKQMTAAVNALRIAHGAYWSVFFIALNLLYLLVVCR
jgi:hypothetical protein